MADSLKVINKLAIQLGQLAVDKAVLEVELDEARGEEREVATEPENSASEDL